MKDFTLNITTNLIPLLSITAVSSVAMIIKTQNKLISISEKLLSTSEQKENLIYSLNHDFKIIALAQQRALEILPQLDKSEQKAIINDIKESNRHSLQMIEMLSYIHSTEKETKFKPVNFGEIFEKYTNKEAFDKNTTSDVANLKNTVINANKKLFGQAIEILCKQIEQLSSDKATCKIKQLNPQKKTEFSITFTPKDSASKAIESILNECPKYASVGQGLKIQFMKKVFKEHNIELETKIYNDNLCKISFLLENAHKELCLISNNNTQLSKENCVLSKLNI